MLFKTCLYPILLITLVSCSGQKKKVQDTIHVPKNIVLMIGDGMGIAQVYAGMTANKGHLNIERMPYTGLIKTYSASDYITDSGAGGTALSTGKKTYNGAIGVDKDTIPHKTILEIAEANGLSTGLAVTCAVTHATPAAFIAHNKSRDNYEEIAGDFLKTDIDLFIGGGRINFENRSDGDNLSDKLRNNGYAIIYDTTDLKNTTAHKFAALLADFHLPPRDSGRMNMLPLSVEKALSVLSQNEKGFFLMVEGSQIDWAGHNNNPGYLVSEMIDFDNAIGKVLEFAAKEKNTLVIVTADHETGGAALTNGDIQEGKVEIKFSTDYHTSVMVPVFAYGPGAEKFIGIYENTDIFRKMLSEFGFSSNE